ncbi:FtsQ-type POTRA domain-containing protein [Homoserinimonas sp. A520]
MKRPEGFDAAPEPPRQKTAAAQKPSRQKPSPAKQSRQKPDQPKPAHPKPTPKKPARQKPAQPEPAQKEPVRRKPTRADDTARQARRAARERRRYERDEVRRFTRRARHRRFVWITAAAVVVALVGTVAVAVYSPLLALTRIEITGTSSVDPADIHDAVKGQLGTPLALVDSDRLTRELGEFSLIQSYVTETVPPHTLIIHVTERAPIGSIATASGFTVVDPAGVTITKADTRPEGVPVIELSGADTESDVFDSVVEVLFALPDSVAIRVDRVMAATKDDVTLVLDGTGQQVVWGSADQSDLKARVLAALMATQDPNARVAYDVTAPLSAVIRPI